MLADDMACNPRNNDPGSIYGYDNHESLYDDEVEVDYKGYSVNVDNFLRVLTDRHDDSVPLSKRLLSDEHSNIFIYLV